MDKYDGATARVIIDGINGWEIQSLKPASRGGNAWSVTIGSTPRIVGDLLPGYDEGAEDGITFALQPRDGTAEMDETVLLRRDPGAGEDEPGIAMWGILTMAYESRERGTFEGTIAFYDDEAEGAALMSLAATEISRKVVGAALDEIDLGIDLLSGNGAQVNGFSDRILAQVGRLNEILQAGIAEAKAAE